MNFLALLLGLAIERLLTHLFHLREFRWLDGVFGAAFGWLRPVGHNLALAGLLAVALALAVPVGLVSWALWDEFLRIPYFLFAVLVLLFALGPRDLDDEVEDYCQALSRGDSEAQRRLAKEIMERDPPDDLPARNAAVERAIYVQANNRIFGVVFWFLVLGPTGAWLFRVLDLMRRRAQYLRNGGEASLAAGVAGAVRTLQGAMAWIPARLLALGYVLAGNFEDASASWRHGGSSLDLPFPTASEEIMARVGLNASGRVELDPGNVSEALDRIQGARSLVLRTLWMIWCPIIAVMTLYDWVT